MLPQRLKDLYFAGVVPFTLASHLLWKMRLARGRVPEKFRRGDGGKLWLNVGSGAHPHSSFVNIDGNLMRRPDMWLDLSHGLPFPPNSIDGIYASHVFEHLYWSELWRLAEHCHRMIRPGGTLRMLVPSLEMAVEHYQRGDSSWFSAFPRDHDSLGGRFQNFLFCDGQHRLAFDYSFAKELLEQVGFATVRRCGARESGIFPARVLDDMEGADSMVDISLIVEAVKGDGAA